MSIITTDLVALDVDAGGDKEAVIGRLADRLADAGRATDRDGLSRAAMAREAQSATGLPGGIAIPHCRSPYVDDATIAFARLSPAVDFGAPDGPADLVFLIAAPDSGGAEHMKLLSSLARALVRKDFVESLRNAASADEVVEPGRRRGQPGARGSAGTGTRGRGARRPAEDARRSIAHHRLPDRHRPHLHGRRLAGSSPPRKPGVDDARRDAGLLGQHPAVGRHHRRRRRRHLRHRRRRQGQGPVRGQAGDRLRRQARHQRARQDDRRSRCRSGQSERGPRRGLGGRRRRGAAASAGRTSAGAPAPARSCSPASAT